MSCSTTGGILRRHHYSKPRSIYGFGMPASSRIYQTGSKSFSIEKYKEHRHPRLLSSNLRAAANHSYWEETSSCAEMTDAGHEIKGETGGGRLGNPDMATSLAQLALRISGNK
jgi:hypothetical protein